MILRNGESAFPMDETTDYPVKDGQDWNHMHIHKITRIVFYGI